MKYFLLKAAIFLSIALSGQMTGQITTHYLLHAGYSYQNRSYAELGGRALFLNHDDVLFRLGAAALIGGHQGKVQVLPKLQTDLLFNFQKGVDFYHSWYILAGSEFTTKFIAPKAGISMFGLLDVTAGYGIPIVTKAERSHYSGFNFGITLNVPIVMLREL